MSPSLLHLMKCHLLTTSFVLGLLCNVIRRTVAQTQPSAATFSNIDFCSEKGFDNVFEDDKYVYLNVYDKDRRENRMYRWVAESNAIDQFITAQVDSNFLIPQSGFYSPLYDGFNVRTYRTVSQANDVRVCGTYGRDRRERYNCTDPYPMSPLCGCYQYPPYQNMMKCLRPQTNNRQRPLWVYLPPEEGSLNNKYRSYYFDRGNNSNDALYVFKRFDLRLMLVMRANWTKQGYSGFEIDYEAVGLFTVRRSFYKYQRYLVEEVSLTELGSVLQYVWNVHGGQTLLNQTIILYNRVPWRQHFGCHSSDEISIQSMVGILVFTATVTLSILLSLMFFFFDYDLLVMKAKQTTLSYYLS